MKKSALSKITKLLASQVGRENLITDRDLREIYAHDETSDLSFFPDIAVRVRSTGDVSRVLKICSREGVPVTPRGAGTGVTGGAVPVLGGLVLSLERMNRILEIDRDNMVAVVEPGAVTGDIQRAALEAGLLYPPDPASLDSCSIGGNVAEGAGGPRAVKYGTTKDYVLGLEFVLADGSVITTGGKFVKNATGYNLAGLLIGSEGTLAVVTKIFLRLVPAPLHSLDLLLPFALFDEAIDNVTRILASRVVPSAIEFMEEDAIRLAAWYLKETIPFPDAKAHLLVQIDGNSEEEVRQALERLTSSLTISAESITAAETKGQRERIWRARRAIREAIHAASPVFLAEDTVVPRSAIPDFLKEVKRGLNARGLRSVMFGHAGDGNVHTDVLKEDMNYTAWKKLLPELRREIYRTALSLGGTITGEHGIGCLRRDYLPMAMGKADIRLLKRIKKAFDPKGILNPGKVFK